MKAASTPAAASFFLWGRTSRVKKLQPPRPVLRRTPRLSGPSLTITSATSSPKTRVAVSPSVPSLRIIVSACPG